MLLKLVLFLVQAIIVSQARLRIPACQDESLLVDRSSKTPTWFCYPSEGGTLQLAMNDPQWTRLVAKTQAKAAEEVVRFYLWTRENPIDFQELYVGDVAALTASNFDPTLPTRVLAHGFGSHGLDGFVTGLRDAFLQREASNIISIDWEELAASPDYFTASSSAKPVGEFSATLIDFLVVQGATADLIHILGFSLGAHVAGQTGSAVSRGAVWRVTGLDPAGPGFSLDRPDQRLNSTSGQFVDVIHSNSGGLLDFELGIIDAIGQVYFYPNGGDKQPGCWEKSARGCNHSRSYQYYLESINGITSFKSILCGSFDNFLLGQCDGNQVAYMGHDLERSTTGTFYLQTNAESPYAMG